MNATARTRAFLKIHPLFGAVFLVELLFLAALVAGAFRPLAEVSVPLDSMTRQEDGSSVSQPVTLPSGGYRVTVSYEATYPHWFFNEKKFLNTFNGKYELITDFDDMIDNAENIPSKYKGFFFKIIK